jgi:hypothetical protein
MQTNRHIVNKTCPVHTSRVNTHQSGSVSFHIRRAASLAVALGATIVLATSCSSAVTAFNARLISPGPTNPQSHFEDDNGTSRRGVLALILISLAVE